MNNPKPTSAPDLSALPDSPSTPPSSTEGAVDTPLTPSSLSDPAHPEVESVRASERPSNGDQLTAVEVLEQSGDSAPMTKEEQETAEILRENSVPL